MSEHREIAKALESNRVITGTMHDNMFHSLDGVIPSCRTDVGLNPSTFVERMVETSTIEANTRYDT